MATATDTAPAATAKGPIEKFHDRGVSLSIFPNAAARDDGTIATFFNTVIESRYRDKNGDWQSGSSFSKEQLYALRFLVDEALRAIHVAEHTQKSADV